eukprot:TRINITY_DN39273_c0_g1_i1.p1 TRINITY_DN39273_c0_g1~~TRINITY_DN39273_c0_g1_i1.p1  ORF type:complete len:622 (+),score=76.08 TRINITY_DN39273_c0_g1_i1:74-1867(+)
MAAHTNGNGLDLVKQCIEMIEQEALGLMSDPAGVQQHPGIRALSNDNLDEARKLLGSAADKPESDTADFKQKLSMLATGIQVLTDKINDKSRQLEGEDNCLHEGVSSPIGTCTEPDRGELTPASPGGGAHSVQTRQQRTVSASSLPSDGVKSHLYTEALERLTESHAALKCKMAALEAENKRLHDEAAVWAKQEQTRRLQQDILATHQATPNGSTSAPSASSTPRRPRGGRSQTPPVPRPLPPWRSPLHKPLPHEAAANSSVAAKTGLRPPGYISRFDHQPETPGRSTPRAPLPGRVGGAESVPVSRGTPRMSTSTGLVGGQSRVNCGVKVKAPQASGPAGVEDTRGGRAKNLPAASASKPKRQASASPPRGRSITPPVPPRSISPRRKDEKELPPNWKSLIASAFCEETGRPIADRITLTDFTSAASKKAELLFWVNAKVRWADLKITEKGRVPHRGEDVVLFVLHGTRPASPPSPKKSPRSVGSALTSRASQRATSPPPGPVTWKVGSCRVLRHLPFNEEGDMPAAAILGGGLLKYALGIDIEISNTGLNYAHALQPPQASGAVRQYSMPVASSPRAPSPCLRTGSHVASPLHCW